MAKNAKKGLYGEITKVEEQPDGTLIVEGVASSEAKDAAGEVIKADAMRAAIPEYMRFGNVREMHQLIAAGTALDVSVGDDGVTTIKAHVVDPTTIDKVQAKVLKGFSIGGKVTARDDTDKSIITGLALTEISLVDRPCNPDAVINCYKVDDADDLQKGMYELGEFSDILRYTSYLVRESQWEADAEGDDSPIPAQLLEWLKQGVAIFNSMAAEETAELVTSLENLVSKSQQADDLRKVDNDLLQKAGQKFSKTTKAALASIHEQLKACEKAMTELGYDADGSDDDDDAEKANKPDDLQKAEQPISQELGDLAKSAKVDFGANATASDLAKAALQKSLELGKEVERLKAMPETPKATTTDISKAQDMGQKPSEPDPVRKSDGSIDEAATLIKAAQAKPMRIF